MKGNSRYLRQKSGRRVWLYCRAVPKDMKSRDSRAPTVTISTRTEDLEEARQFRNRQVRRDDDYWQALRSGMDATTARDKYDAALQMQQAKAAKWFDPDLTYEELEKEGGDIELSRTLDEAYHSVMGRGAFDHWPAVVDGPSGEKKLVRNPKRYAPATNEQRAAIDVILAGTTGLVAEAPELNVQEAFQFWREDLARHEWENKSPEQRRNWGNPVTRAADNFEKIVGGGHPFMRTTRPEAIRVREWLQKRILKEEITNSTANRDMGLLRKVWQAIADYQGLDESNPFRKLQWPKSPTSRPPFTVEWVSEKFLLGTELAGMNPEARRAILAMIETGCRPSEILNLRPENIHLDADIPYLRIREMPGREIKSKNSDRSVPLVGISLSAMSNQPDGFPRYRDRENAFSGMANKYLRKNGLLESEKHSVYSIRHLFKDRLRVGINDSELRDELMGQAQGRPHYGSGFSLEKKLEELSKIALPFDPNII